jgi:hypothetical protein
LRAFLASAIRARMTSGSMHMTAGKYCMSPAQEARVLGQGRGRVMTGKSGTRTGFVSITATLLAGAAMSAVASNPHLHQPTFECTDSGSLRVTCRGGFADGTSAAGITVRVLDKRDRVVYVGTVDRLGRVSFRKPDAEFSVVFDAGEGNVLTLLGSEMT